LIVSDDDAEAAAATGCEVRSYRGFSVEADRRDRRRGRVRFAEVVARRRVGVEAGALPAALAAGLTASTSRRARTASARSRTPTSCR